MADVDAPKPQLSPFTPPKFHWNQDNLYQQFMSFKHVVEFAFKGQNKTCSNNVKCGSILNWLGIEAYPIYDNLPMTAAQKEDPTQLLDAFKNISNLKETFFSLGMPWGLYIVEHPKHNPNFITNLIQWQMTVALPIRRR